MKDIIDTTDFCRRCKGEGGHRDQTDRGTWITETCTWCRGTGFRTITVGKEGIPT
jgi:DnaJ-class molecular chaperone